MNDIVENVPCVNIKGEKCKRVEYKDCNKKQKKLMVKFIRDCYSASVINIRDIINGVYVVFTNNIYMVAVGFELKKP